MFTTCRWGGNFWGIHNAWDDNIWFFTVGYTFYALGHSNLTLTLVLTLILTLTLYFYT